MITPEECQRAITAAYSDADAFVAYYPSTSFFERANWGDTVAALQRFIWDQVQVNIAVLTSLPEGYASWLIRLANGQAGIALDTRQMSRWYLEGSPPTPVEEIRSILHELGHIRLSPRLLQGTRANPVQVTYADAAQPDEEDLAWNYALYVLGFLIGDYSSATRTASNRDDAPRLQL